MRIQDAFLLHGLLYIKAVSAAVETLIKTEIGVVVTFLQRLDHSSYRGVRGGKSWWRVKPATGAWSDKIII